MAVYAVLSARRMGCYQTHCKKRLGGQLVVRELLAMKTEHQPYFPWFLTNRALPCYSCRYHLSRVSHSARHPPPAVIYLDSDTTN